MAVDKLIDSSQLDADLTSVADAIRAKGGTSGNLVFPSGFVSAVNDLPQMTGDMAWLGKDAQQVSGEFYSKVDYLKNTLYASWTPSSTAKAIVASVTLSSNKFSAANLDEWAYYIVWDCGIDVEYTGSPADTARTLMSRGLIIQELIRRPGSWAAIGTETFGTTVNQSAYASTFMRYYNDKSSLTYTWSASYGFYNSATAPTIANTSNLTTDITPKTPTLNARTSNTYMSVANANLIDQANSVWWIKGAGVYKAKHDTYYDGVYKRVCDRINATSPTVPTT